MSGSTKRQCDRALALSRGGWARWLQVRGYPDGAALFDGACNRGKTYVPVDAPVCDAGPPACQVAGAAPSAA